MNVGIRTCNVDPLHWDRREVIFLLFLKRQPAKLKWRTRKILSDLIIFTNMYISVFQLFLLLPWVQNISRTLLQRNGQHHVVYPETCHHWCKNNKQLICVRGMLSRAFWLLAFYSCFDIFHRTTFSDCRDAWSSFR